MQRTMTVSRLPRRAVVRFVAACSFWALALLFAWIAWEHSVQFRRLIAALSLIPLLGPAIMLLALHALVVAGVIFGHAAAKLARDSTPSTSPRAKSSPTDSKNTDAVVEAIGQHAAGRTITSSCASCNTTIRVTEMGKLNSSTPTRLNIQCSCGACNGNFSL